MSQQQSRPLPLPCSPPQDPAAPAGGHGWRPKEFVFKVRQFQHAGDYTHGKTVAKATLDLSPYCMPEPFGPRQMTIPLRWGSAQRGVGGPGVAGVCLLGHLQSCGHRQAPLLWVNCRAPGPTNHSASTWTRIPPRRSQLCIQRQRTLPQAFASSPSRTPQAPGPADNQHPHPVAAQLRP